ncbi:stalk domain-containing protein [Brevibacillus fluminis]|uniref:stalk domain-containing protein n=1 Tax=Brevibacillus fluminis TaxID=511487 RepID=UPI003F899936
MKKIAKPFILLTVVSLCLTIFPISSLYAEKKRDHEEHENYEKKSEERSDHYREHDDDDDDEEHEFTESEQEGSDKEQDAYHAPILQQVEPNQSVTRNVSPFTDGQHVKLLLPDSAKPIDIQLHVEQGELWLPAGQLLGALNIPCVTYEKGTILELYGGGKHFIYHTNKNVAYSNGQKEQIPFPPKSVQHVFYLPLTEFANGLGYTFTWDPSAGTMAIERKDSNGN